MTSEVFVTSEWLRLAVLSALESEPLALHVIRERDVGLFSLVQQVIANVPWALGEGRIPVADFRERTCYWIPGGYDGHDSVWEYYFEPLVSDFPAASISDGLRTRIDASFPDQDELGAFVAENAFVTNHFGDHPAIEGKSLTIPYMTGDPSPELRLQTSTIIGAFVRPRTHVVAKVEAFFGEFMRDSEVIGVHVRGTDAVSDAETRLYRKGSLDLRRYEDVLTELLAEKPDAKILVATDAEASLSRLRNVFGDRVIAYDSIRHQEGGEVAGTGPTGRIMPAYISSDPAVAAQNGEDAVVEYLLLSRCAHLVHNGASLAMTSLLQNATLPHTNTHARG